MTDVMKTAEGDGGESYHCYWHYKTVESGDWFDCTAHMHESRVFLCPYKSHAEATESCGDYRLLEENL